MSTKKPRKAPVESVVLTPREARVLKMLGQGWRLWPVKFSRMYGLFAPSETRRPQDLIQRRVIESLKAKGKIKIGCIDSASEYVLDR